MKKTISVILLVAIFVLVLLAPTVFSRLPITGQEPLAQREAAFRGIITVTAAPTFSPGKGSFSSWLLACAKEYERLNPGILVRVEEITPGQLKRRLETGGNPPDILLTGAGALLNPEGLLTPLPVSVSAEADEALAARCSLGGVQYGVPVALGAYGLILNTEWLDRAQASPSMEPGELFETLVASGGKKAALALQCPQFTYGLPQIALCQILGALPDDLPGLPADLGLANPTLAWPEYALDQRFAMYMGTQREVERLRVLRSGGRAFATGVVALTGGAWTDQILYASVVQRLEEHAGRDAASLAFLEHIASAPMQEKLRNIGVFAAHPAVELYDEDAQPDMRALEISLKGAAYPNVFGFGADLDTAHAAMRAATAPNRAPLAAWQAVAGGEE